MNINAAFPSKYIKASDLDGKTVTVTIREVKIEQIGRENDPKPVIYFSGKDKGMVLNKTNARKIAQIVGAADTEQWTGAKIALFATEVEFSGDMVEAIRVKPAPATAKAAPPVSHPLTDDEDAPLTDEDIPF
jgi:sucrose-6-phosphate hydrolase SacC (GH32 family)